MTIFPGSLTVCSLASCFMVHKDDTVAQVQVKLKKQCHVSTLQYYNYDFAAKLNNLLCAFFNSKIKKTLDMEAV